MTEHAPSVVDDAEAHRFLYRVEGVDAQLLYRVDGDRLVLVHTEVPRRLGGRGIGGRLVRAALARAERTGETVLPQCAFARRWLHDHPDATGAASIDWGGAAHTDFDREAR